MLEEPVNYGSGNHRFPNLYGIQQNWFDPNEHIRFTQMRPSTVG